MILLRKRYYKLVVERQAVRQYIWIHALADLNAFARIWGQATVRTAQWAELSRLKHGRIFAWSTITMFQEKCLLIQRLLLKLQIFVQVTVVQPRMLAILTQLELTAKLTTFVYITALSPLRKYPHYTIQQNNADIPVPTMSRILDIIKFASLI